MLNGNSCLYLQNESCDRDTHNNLPLPVARIHQLAVVSSKVLHPSGDS